MSGFEDRVRQALDALPPDLARGLENVAVVVEEENADDPASSACSRKRLTCRPR